MSFIANVFVESSASIEKIPDEYIVSESEVNASTVSVEVSDVEGVSELEYSDNVTIEFTDGLSVELSDARLMGAGMSSGY